MSTAIFGVYNTATGTYFAGFDAEFEIIWASASNAMLLVNNEAKALAVSLANEGLPVMRAAVAVPRSPEVVALLATPMPPFKPRVKNIHAYF